MFNVRYVIHCTYCIHDIFHIEILSRYGSKWPAAKSSLVSTTRCYGYIGYSIATHVTMSNFFFSKDGFHWFPWDLCLTFIFEGFNPLNGAYYYNAAWSFKGRDRVRAEVPKYRRLRIVPTESSGHCVLCTGLATLGDHGDLQARHFYMGQSVVHPSGFSCNQHVGYTTLDVALVKISGRYAPHGNGHSAPFSSACAGQWRRFSRRCVVTYVEIRDLTPASFYIDSFCNDQNFPKLIYMIWIAI